MSRASDKSKDGAEGKVNSVGSLASDDDDHDNDNAADVEDDGREETPDLYRNSSLGMYVLPLGFRSTSADIWDMGFQVRRSKYLLNVYVFILLN